ncbi:MarR family winged helix-turn-helix transcriptional regulator [Halarcobacter ebronensis]|nr:MarR family transcriptional regulator [Halarcobacter ebronensis]QKF82977.1 transcriptional regulator, MarR family [Halarcobacter ebronensis]
MKNNEKVCIAFLLAKVHHKLRHRLNQKLRKYDLTIEQRQILLRLFTFGAMSQRELCEKTLTEPSNITITLKRMEQRGYIQKVKHPKDKRALLIEATEKAFKLQKTLEELGRNTTKNFLGDIEQSKIDTTIEVLQQMYKNELDIELNDVVTREIFN